MARREPVAEVSALLDMWGADRRQAAHGRDGVRAAWPEIGQRLDDLLDTRDESGPHADYDAGVREELVDALTAEAPMVDRPDAERVADALIDHPALLRALARFSGWTPELVDPEDR